MLLTTGAEAWGRVFRHFRFWLVCAADHGAEARGVVFRHFQGFGWFMLLTATTE